MSRMTNDERLALKWALEQDDQAPQPRGTKAALILAKYIERSAGPQIEQKIFNEMIEVISLAKYCGRSDIEWRAVEVLRKMGVEI